ncbi:exopolysaccharide biosynthesis protein [Rhizobium sp. CECT 9324]|uniref:exopolysaccharide biosynthesis protein n=1 Tax=Rhizobium sp. CECT 9324 TaxID=2845820 RepID=UPI001E2845AE|nr:exopolysaccharide biosynthesis protein [Rhizobium sp. CECT 9324]CAH0342166.1 hypothetical protein RHI9324_03883 [Rhizobium sp. CECT 9324]
MTDPETQTNDPRKPGIASLRLASLVTHAETAGSVSLDELLAAMGRTSIAFAILILSLPALNPIPGPFGMVFGTCLAIIAVQIMAGYQRIWLPAFLGRRRISANVIGLIVRYTSPLVSRVETVLRRNRMRHFAGRTAQSLLGIPVFLLAIAVALPIPFGNFLPVAALVMIALGLMERDGLMAMLGVALGIIALATSGGLIYGAIRSLGWAIG